MIKVAMVGLGIMGKTHYDCYMNNEETELVAIADPAEAAVRERIGDSDIPIYHDMDELLEKHDVDMVDICTPTGTHVELSIKALEKGIHVLCEKPMSLTSDEASKLTAAANKSDKKFMVAHVVRFMAPYMYLKKIYETKELGELTCIEMRRVSGIPQGRYKEWIKDTAQSGGLPLDMSIHDVDFCRFAFGEPKDVKAVYSSMKDSNDYIYSTLIYDNFAANIVGGWYKYDLPWSAGFVAIFENGVLEFNKDTLCKNGEEVDLKDFSVLSNTGMKLVGASYKEEIEYFISCIKTGKDPEIVPPKSSEESVRLIEKIKDAAFVI